MSKCLGQSWRTYGLQSHKVRPSGPVVKNAKFCNEYEIYKNYNFEVPYEISDHRCASWSSNEAQNIHAKTRYPDAVSTKAILDKSSGEQKVNEW